ncbi:MAG: hypothetical protein LBE22_05860 [Azoarcus sp.]|nr:hypothetical protein [Azoarcus sp.]
MTSAPAPASTPAPASAPTPDPAMRYILALEAIDQEVARITVERIHEMDREAPSPAILAYLRSCMTALAWLRQNLAHKDMDAIDAILSRSLFSIKGPENA